MLLYMSFLLVFFGLTIGLSVAQQGQSLIPLSPTANGFQTGNAQSNIVVDVTIDLAVHV
jgi:hypothetical protein